MVQIGNLHIGQAETIKPPEVDSGEAFLMWDYLVSRYGNIQLTQLLQNYAHDPDLKLLLKSGLTLMENQVNKVETELNRVQIPLPNRPPKTVSTDIGSEVWSDQFIFSLIFTDIQGFLEQHIRVIRSITTNDTLRKMFISFLYQEIDVFDELCKYSKLKGWLASPPMLKLH